MGAEIVTLYIRVGNKELHSRRFPFSRPSPWPSSPKGGEGERKREDVT
jgi:hypothetical protein